METAAVKISGDWLRFPILFKTVKGALSVTAGSTNDVGFFTPADGGDEDRTMQGSEHGKLSSRWIVFREGIE